MDRSACSTTDRGLRCFACRARLSDYPDRRVRSHWHDDFEFVCINAGRMRYTVNGEGYVLRAGDGLFVNSCQAHACESCEGEDCEYFCMVLHPSLLGAKRLPAGEFCAAAFAQRRLCLPAAAGDDALAARRIAMRARGLRSAGGGRSRRRAFRNEPGLSRPRRCSRGTCPRPGRWLWKRTGARWPCGACWAMCRSTIGRGYPWAISLRRGGVSISACCELFRRHTGQTPRRVCDPLPPGTGHGTAAQPEPVGCGNRAFGGLCQRQLFQRMLQALFAHYAAWLSPRRGGRGAARRLRSAAERNARAMRGFAAQRQKRNRPGTRCRETGKPTRNGRKRRLRVA